MNPLPPIPHNRGFVIPDEYAALILSDTGPDDPQRIIMFGDRLVASQLESTLWLGDGTFKSVPELFFQLYTIHTKAKSKIIYMFLGFFN